MRCRMKMYFNIIPSNTVMHNFKLQFPFSCKMTNLYAGIKSRKTPSCLRQRFSHFHPYDKLCGHSLFRFFGKADISLMGFHDLFGNGKPQTGSLLAVAGLIPHSEGFKDNIRDLRRDSLSVVRNGDLDAVSLSRDLKAQYGSLLIVPQRIGNDIFKHAPELLCVNVTKERLLRNEHLQVEYGQGNIIVFGCQIFPGKLTDIFPFQCRAEIRMLQFAVLIKGVDQFIES